jgi:hypothetical protein
VPYSEFVQQWWPLPTSLDLVRGEPDMVASAVLTEVSAFMSGEQLSSEWIPFDSIAHIFESVEVFTNVPTVYFVLPTHSDWTVLWNNSFLCAGYDSLCWCLTNHHGMETFHWQSSNEDAVFQAGSLFTARRYLRGGLTERTVYCCKNDAHWEFHTSGEPLPEEDILRYRARRKRDRFDERGMMELLSKIGARPWEDSFYRTGKAFRIIERVSFPDRIYQKTFAELAHKRAW